MSSDEDSIILNLRKRVATLEIENDRLSAEVRDIKKSLKSTTTHSKAARASLKGRSVATEIPTPRPPPKHNYKVFKDRDGTVLDIGTKVVILTSGAHTDRSRQGAINGFDEYRNRMYTSAESHKNGLRQT